MITTILLAASIGLFGQNKSENKDNVRAGIFGWGMGDVPESWDNMKTEKISSFVPQQDLLAVRICSADPLLVALETAFVSPINRVDELENQGIYERDPKTGEPKNWQYYVPKNRAVFLRQNKTCRITKDKPADVEFWIVRPNNELPEFVEARKVSEISDFDIILGDAYFKDGNHKKDTIENNYSKGEKLTPEIYKTALMRVVNFMKEKRMALTVIKIPFYGRFPNKIINNHALEAQNFLKKNGIGSYRIFIKKISYGNDVPSNEDIDEYPSISIVYEN